MDQYWHPDHFTCSKCGKVLQENEFYEKDGLVYCIDDFLNLFAPKCRSCTLPIKDEYCLAALDGDWHANCFRCKDCNILLEDRSFFEIDGEPYCEQHFHARQCPDCIRVRRAQNQYFGISTSTPMGVSRWASQVSLKSLDIFTQQPSTSGGRASRPISQISQYSTTSYDTAYSGGKSSPNPSGRSSYIIPIEREGVSTNNKVQRSSSGVSNMSYNGHHNHVHGDDCNHSHHDTDTESEMYQQRSSLKQQGRPPRGLGDTRNLSLSQHSLQYIARNENPYNYLEPGKFPVEPKHIRFSDTVTKKEFEVDTKYF